MGRDYFVYVIECTNGRFYTGYTVDLVKRFDEHSAAKSGAKFTRSFRPEKIIASWKISGERGDAMKIEAFIKSLSKKEKIIITENPELLENRVRLVKDLNCEIKVYDLEKLFVDC